MAVCLKFGGCLVVHDLVGTEDVGAVMNDDMAVKGKYVAYAALTVGVQLNRDAGGWLGFDPGNRQHFLTWVVGELIGGRAGGGVNNEAWLLESGR